MIIIQPGFGVKIFDDVQFNTSNNFFTILNWGSKPLRINLATTDVFPQSEEEAIIGASVPVFRNEDGTFRNDRYPLYNHDPNTYLIIRHKGNKMAINTISSLQVFKVGDHPSVLN
jgi:hypothetical protein